MWCAWHRCGEACAQQDHDRTCTCQEAARASRACPCIAQLPTMQLSLQWRAPQGKQQCHRNFSCHSRQKADADSNLQSPSESQTAAGLPHGCTSVRRACSSASLVAGASIVSARTSKSMMSDGDCAQRSLTRHILRPVLEGCRKHALNNAYSQQQTCHNCYVADQREQCCWLKR